MSESDAPVHRARLFTTTRWSIVIAAAGDTSSTSRDALAKLCDIYWYPVYAMIRAQRHTAEDARDLTQEFFTRLLEKHYVRAADRNRGRFRSFLAAAVRHFLSNERDRARAVKRGGARPAVALDLETAERRYRLEPPDPATPQKVFDRRWAVLLLNRVLAEVHQENVQARKGALFDALKGFLTGDRSDRSYADIGRELGMTEGAVKVAVHRLRRQFRAALIAEISETVSSANELDDEIRHLRDAVRT